jgi:hypothetical protein
LPSDLNVEDLFALGIGLDLVGAVLLGLGLLLSPTLIAWRGTWFGLGRVSGPAAKDRVSAEFGIAALVAGFVCQAIGYIGVLDGRRVVTGRDAAVEGVISALAGVLVGGGLYLLFGRSRLKRVLVLVAAEAPWDRDDIPNSPDESHPPWRPHGPGLRRMGESVGFNALDDEPLDKYLARVFRVTDYFEPESSNPTEG